MGGLFSSPDTSAQERQLEEMRKQNEVEKARQEEERRNTAEQAASGLRARQRGGKRMLLADTRLTPEAGVQTLGATNFMG